MNLGDGSYLAPEYGGPLGFRVEGGKYGPEGASWDVFRVEGLEA